MKVHKNWCNACQVNFFTETMFFEHIVGTYPDQPGKMQPPVGKFHRHHLTEAELHEKGWSCQELPVSEWQEGERVLVPRMTWVMPGQLEDRERRDEQVKRVGFKKRFQKGP